MNGDKIYHSLWEQDFIVRLTFSNGFINADYIKFIKVIITRYFSINLSFQMLQAFSNIFRNWFKLYIINNCGKFNE